MKIKALALAISLLATSLTSRADEGMWIPFLLQKMNEADMQKAGLKLSASDIYDINKSSIKDAIVSLGGFCTAEVISSKGLLLTNHHCAYEALQSHSSVSNDYLTEGFWAKTLKDELPNESLVATFLVRIEDVTNEIVGQLTSDMDAAARAEKIREIAAKLEEKAVEGTDYDAQIKGFFSGNEFYLFVTNTYLDVRLVGAPPSSIGKYGGDTDNWMWPRHTGDFSMLRVYSDKEGKPAAYSQDNVPLAPKHHLPVSLKGVAPGDFTMIMGYPGRTDRYLSSYGVQLAISKEQPTRVKIRGKKLEIMKEHMDASEEVKIQYSAKYAQVSNYWKYFIGQTRGLKRLKVYDKKLQIEKDLSAWIKADPKRTEKYGTTLDKLASSYAEKDAVTLPQVYYEEAAFGVELNLFALQFYRLKMALEASPLDQDVIASLTGNLKAGLDEHFKNYDADTDKELMVAMLEMMRSDVGADFLPDIFTTIEKKYKGNVSNFVNDVFAKSILVERAKVNAFLDDPKAKTLQKDLGIQAGFSFLNGYFFSLKPFLTQIDDKMQEGYRLFVAALREMNPDKKYYPNANSTMRLTYGNVGDYYPGDAMHYDFVTTLKGVMEKEDPTNEEFIVPAKLKDLYYKKDYGRYADKNGDLPVCFITNTDITGGNSGSPVINGNGELVGCAFDGNWEAMSGDIAFEPELQRTICVDARYILFIIDKFAGAGHLVDEMTLATTPAGTVQQPAPAGKTTAPASN